MTLKYDLNLKELNAVQAWMVVEAVKKQDGIEARFLRVWAWLSLQLKDQHNELFVVDRKSLRWGFKFIAKVYEWYYFFIAIVFSVNLLKKLILNDFWQYSSWIGMFWWAIRSIYAVLKA